MRTWHVSDEGGKRPITNVSICQELLFLLHRASRKRLSSLGLEKAHINNTEAQHTYIALVAVQFGS